MGLIANGSRPPAHAIVQQRSFIGSLSDDLTDQLATPLTGCAVGGIALTICTDVVAEVRPGTTLPRPKTRTYDEPPIDGEARSPCRQSSEPYSRHSYEHSP